MHFITYYLTGADIDIAKTWLAPLMGPQKWLGLDLWNWHICFICLCDSSLIVYFTVQLLYVLVIYFSVLTLTDSKDSQSAKK